MHKWARFSKRMVHVPVYHAYNTTHEIPISTPCLQSFEVSGFTPRLLGIEGALLHALPNLSSCRAPLQGRHQRTPCIIQNIMKHPTPTDHACVHSKSTRPTYSDIRKSPLHHPHPPVRAPVSPSPMFALLRGPHVATARGRDMLRASPRPGLPPPPKA